LPTSVVWDCEDGSAGCDCAFGSGEGEELGWLSVCATAIPLANSKAAVLSINFFMT